MPNDRNLLLKLENLSARIGRQVVLSNVSLSIKTGECVAVVGGSGAGKSTLLRCLMGLTRPASPFEGRLVFNGKETHFPLLQNARKPERIAYVPQNPDQGFDPLKRLAWQWRQASRIITGASDFTDRQKQLLEQLGLKPFGRSFPHEWSRGMQQRLLVAMALIGEPRLLILDEPTSALDPLIAAQVLRAVKAYAELHDIAVLIVTHDLSLAARNAHSTAIMNSGRVVEFGETATLLSSPQSDYGRLLVKHRDWTVLSNPQSSGSITAEQSFDAVS
ncbi:dipeptide/oligopeptide/nickel ABC transporter ATP-binding protein [Roseibium sp. MMSF_3544]|uniref:ABC transporter ATP-binding protein n=1 Tax=unclassified Roseibium TaxID=2629323 RepID=UPI00273DD59E|nr:dipeptide/oligopeptide/nickel ABC transporter ATP-binding protein [Roseibium sp. MMSF_3544]